MKLTIQRETLLEPLQLVIGVVERRQTLPILSNVLLSLEQQSLSITATDLEIELVGRTTLTDSVPHLMQVTVSGRKLLDICKTLPPAAIIDLQSDDKERLIMRSGRSRFILSTLPVDSFPIFEETETNLEFSISQKGLEQLLQRTHFAMAQHDVRYYLNGMLFDIKDGKVRTVATDGHRFAMNLYDGETMNGTVSQVIIPRKGVLELMRLLKNHEAPATTIVGQNFVRVKADDFTFTSKLIDGRFPDYEGALSQPSSNPIVIDRDMLRDAIMRVAILSNEKFRSIKLQLRAGFLHIVANNPEHEEAEEVLTVAYTGKEMDIGFNVSYMLDVLNNVTPGNVCLTFAEANGRMFIKEEGDDKGGLFLVMPLQL